MTTMPRKKTQTAARKSSGKATITRKKSVVKSSAKPAKTGLLALAGVLSKDEADSLNDHVSRLRGYRVVPK